MSHARKYRYIETNAAKDTLTKFGKSDKTPDPCTPEQVKALMERVEGTLWEMPVVPGSLYGMRRSEILGLRWQNVDFENNTFDVVEQLPFKVPPKTKVIEEMAPPKSNGRKLLDELNMPHIRFHDLRHPYVKDTTKNFKIRFSFINAKRAGFLRLSQVCVHEHIPQLISILYSFSLEYASLK